MINIINILDFVLLFSCNSYYATYAVSSGPGNLGKLMFTYGSGGYSTAHIGNLTRGSNGLSYLGSSGPFISRYNDNYSCSVTGVSTDGMVVRVSFQVAGDGSLGDLQNPSCCTLHLLSDNSDIGNKSLVFSDKSQFQFSSNNSSGTLVFELPAHLQTKSSSNATNVLSRYLSTPHSNSVVIENFVLWTSVAFAKACCDIVVEHINCGSLFGLLLLLDSADESQKCKAEQSLDSVESIRTVLAIVAQLRQQNILLPIASFFAEVTNAIASGKDRSTTIVDSVTLLLSIAVPGAFMLSRHALTLMNTRLHPSNLLSQVCRVTLPDWVCNATSSHSCVLLPLFFAGRPIIVMPNFGWADILLANTPKQISVPCACVIAALLSHNACSTINQLSDATGLPQMAVSECIELLLTQNACVSVPTQAEEPSYRLRDSTDWSVDGWVVLNHLSLKTSSTFLSSDYTAVCHWFVQYSRPYEFTMHGHTLLFTTGMLLLYRHLLPWTFAIQCASVLTLSACRMRR